MEELNLLAVPAGLALAKLSPTASILTTSVELVPRTGNKYLDHLLDAVVFGISYALNLFYRPVFYLLSVISLNNLITRFKGHYKESWRRRL